MAKGTQQRTHARVVGKALFAAIGMFAFGYALVPIYNSVCEAFGINGQVRQVSAREAQRETDLGRTITVTFDANTNSRLPWSFKANTTRMEVHPGEMARASYVATNLSGRDVVGQAVYSVTPQEAAMYFKKTECFCFTRQPLQSGESKEMPVIFMLEPGLPKHITNVTLSYTFLRADKYAEAPDPEPGT